MSFLRRTVCAPALAWALSVLTLLSSSALAQPSTVKLLVGFPAGGGSDAIARLLAEGMRQELGANVVVENKAGAGGQIAAQALKAANPDGGTLFVSHDHSVSILPLVMKNAGYDPSKDFVPVGGFASFVNLIALSPGTPATTLPGYIDWVKTKQGGKGSVGIPAPASIPQFLVETLGKHYKVDLVSAPYRGSAPMMGEMLGNQIAAGVASTADMIENHRAGKLRIVAVMGTQRQKILPDVPTFAELGIHGFEEIPYYGVFAPSGTPKPVIDKLAQALSKTVARRDIRAQLINMGMDVNFISSEQMAARERSYREAMARIIKQSGFQPQ